MADTIPQEFIDDLLSRVDIVELIDKRVPLRKAGRNFVACCPFHDEKTPSFHVSPSKQFYHCFGCGVGGSVIGFLMDYERLEFVDAIEELAGMAGVKIPPQSVRSPLRHQHADLFALVSLADRFFRQQLRQHPARDKAVEYLRSRGIDGKTAQAFGIGYAPPGWDSLLRALTQRAVQATDLVTAGLVIGKDTGGFYDRFRDRIMFPIRDRRGRTIAFGGRALDDAAPPKYLNSPETPIFHKSRELYGFYEALKQRQLSQLLVVEGYMDVVGLAQHGIGYAVATLGTATTTEHLEKLFRTCRELVFCYDGDRAGREAAWRALENTLPLLRDGRQAKFLFLPDGEDPDSLIRQEGQKAFEQRLQRAQPLSDYFFQHLSSQTSGDSLDDRAFLAELAKPMLRKLPKGAFRNLMVQRLIELTKLSEHKLGLESGNRLPQPVRRLREPARTNLAYQALQILLLRPELAQQVKSTEALRLLDLDGVTLLLEMIELWQQRPHIQTISVIESHTDSETASQLKKLFQRQLLLAEDDYEVVFFDALQELNKQAQKALFDRVMAGKLSPAQLSPTERQLLRDYGKPQELKQV